MIRALVDFALNNRFLIVLATLLLLIWGGISFHNLPVEAYPDVGAAPDATSAATPRFWLASRPTQIIASR